jgi:hypothetical protein
MARWRQAIELAIKDEDIERLMVISRSRTEAASRVERAQMLLTYRENPLFLAVGQRLGVHHQTVQRCVERAVAYGPLAALDDRLRPGKVPTITPEAKRPPPQPRVHRIPQASRCRLSDSRRDQVDPRQSFRAHLKRNQNLARPSTGRPLRVHLHTQAWLLAQPRRGLLLQIRPLDPAPHPGRIKAGDREQIVTEPN